MRAPLGYVLGKCLHSGRTARVHLATRESDQAEVVLKTSLLESSPERARSARKQLELLRAIQGPHIPRAFELLDVESAPTLVLEHVPGLRLGAWLAAAQPKLEKVLAFAVEAAQALEEVHAAHAIHCNVSPEHFLIEPTSAQVHLVGFGLARPLGSAARVLDLALGLRGSASELGCISPEQTGRMNRGLDARSDLYSLGATLYFALSGRLPFETEDPLALVHAHLAKLPRSLLEHRPQLPPTLSRIVLKLLQKEPEDRYQTAHALRRDLAQCLEQLQRTDRVDDDIPLGTADAPVRPLFAKRVYGRTAEVAALSRAWQQSAAGTAHWVQIGAPPGYGKSALVHELRRPLNDRGGYLCCGKFDPGRDLPYFGLGAALDSLAQQLLMESQAQLAHWRSLLEEALGNLAPVMAQLLPHLRFLLGELGPPKELGPQETRVRLALAVTRFLRACARPEHPIVIFLDDLQWADAGSRYLLGELGDELAGASLLLILAYRSDEVHDTHPAASLLHELERRSWQRTKIELRPLDPESSAQMLADALGCPPEATRELARCIQRKVGGSPLLIQQFVSHLQGQGLIRFAQNQWHWDDDAVAAAVIPDGAVALMIDKLQRLPARLREVIALASCAGDEFDAELLSECADQTSAVLEGPLFELTEEGLLAPSPAGLRFSHDRIREASQALLSGQERAALHRRAGLLLLERIPAERLEERSFEIADHLNRALDQLSEPEKLRAFEIDLRAGCRALRAGVPATAASYLHFARAFFRDELWETHRARAFELFWNGAEAALQLPDLPLALRLLDVLQGHALDPLELARLEGKRIIIYTMTGEPEPLGYALAVLRRHGIRWPRRPSRARIWLELLRTDWVLRGPLDERSFGEVRTHDPRWIAPLLILGTVGAIFTRSSNRLPVLSSGAVMRLVRRHGRVTNPGYGLGGYASFRVLARGDLRGVERYTRAVEHWLAAEEPSQRAVRGLFVLQAYLLPWIRPRRSVLEPLLRTAEMASELGERQFAFFAIHEHASFSALVGEPLEAVVQALGAAERSLPSRADDYVSGYARAYELLLHESASPEDYLERLSSAEPIHARSDATATYSGIHWVAVLSLLGDHIRAEALAERLAPVIEAFSTPGAQLADYTMFRGLCAFAAARSGGALQRWRRRRTGRACLAQLLIWARHGPDFQHMAELVRAEQARARGHWQRALALYQKAAARASAQQYRHHAALAHERRAELLSERGRKTEADAALRAAANLYRSWGALRKAHQLEP